MRIEITTNFDISKLDMGELNQRGLINSSQVIKGMAQDNAPYDTGKLRQSIGIAPWVITRTTDEVNIGPRKVVYAIRREFENKRNPWKRFYMKRAFMSAETVVKQEFEKALSTIIRKM